jgi:hypothetical protein
MGWMELVAYALPVNFFIALLGVVVGVIVAAVNGVFAIGLLLGGPIYAAVSAIIGSLIAGLIWHPVSKWIVNSFLKGSSDEKSRSNWFIATMTASSLNAIPSAVTGLMAILMRIPYVGGFFGIIPPLVSLVATGVGLYTLYSWLKHFGVVNWAQKVVMVLGILAVLGTGVGVIQAVLNSIRMLGSGGGSAIAASAGAGASAADVEKAAAEAMKNAGMTAEQIEAMKKGGLTPEQQAEMQKKIAEMQKASAKALENAGEAGEQAKKLTDAAMKAAAEAQENAKKAAADAEKTGKEAGAKAEKAEKSGKSAAKKAEEEEEEEQPSKAAKAEKAEKAVERRTAPVQKPMMAAAVADEGTLTPFMQFIRKRELVEKTISEDPALLKREDVLNSYKRYLKKTNEIRSKWAKKKSKDFVETRINDHMKDLEVFEGTSRMVEELHGKLFQ